MPSPVWASPCADIVLEEADGEQWVRIELDPTFSLGYGDPSVASHPLHQLLPPTIGAADNPGRNPAESRLGRSQHLWASLDQWGRKPWLPAALPGGGGDCNVGEASASRSVWKVAARRDEFPRPSSGSWSCGRWGPTFLLCTGPRKLCGQSCLRGLLTNEMGGTRGGGGCPGECLAFANNKTASV